MLIGMVCAGAQLVMTIIAQRNNRYFIGLANHIDNGLAGDFVGQTWAEWYETSTSDFWIYNIPLTVWQF